MTQRSLDTYLLDKILFKFNNDGFQLYLTMFKYKSRVHSVMQKKELYLIVGSNTMLLMVSHSQQVGTDRRENPHFSNQSVILDFSHSLTMIQNTLTTGKSYL